MSITQYSKNGNRAFDSRMSGVVSAYQNRYPTLFALKAKEAKDDVRFVYIAAR